MKVRSNREKIKIIRVHVCRCATFENSYSFRMMDFFYCRILIEVATGALMSL